MRMKRLVAGMLSLIMTFPQVTNIYAEEVNYYDRAFIEALKVSDEFVAQYPNGQFEFLAGSMNATEGDRSLDIAVIRKGGTQGEASLNLKAIDVSARYGEDYVIKVKDGLFSETLEADPEARPLVDAYSEVSEISENEGLSQDDIIAVIDSSTTDSSLTVKKVLEQEGAIVEEAASEEEPVAAQEDTSDEVATREGSVFEQISDGTEVVPKAENNGVNASGLKNARNGQVGNYSDRKDWTEAVDNSNSEVVAYANDAVADWAEEMPGVNTTLNFKDGEYVKVFTVQLFDDNLSESDEQVMFFLTDVQGGELGDVSKSYLNIQDNDVDELMKFEMAASNINVSRQDGVAEVTIRRTAGIAKFGSIMVQTGEITAKAGIDFEAGQTEVVFPQGVTERTVKIPIIREAATQDGLQFRVMMDSSSESVNSSKASTIVTLDSGVLDANDLIAQEKAEEETYLLDGERVKRDEKGFYKEIILSDDGSEDGVSAYGLDQNSITGAFTLNVSNWSGGANQKTINVDLSRITHVQVDWENNSGGTYWAQKGCRGKIKASGYYRHGCNIISFDGKSYNQGSGSINFGRCTNTFEVPESARNENSTITFKTQTYSPNGNANLIVYSVKLYYADVTYTVNVGTGVRQQGTNDNNSANNSYVDIKTWSVDGGGSAVYDAENNAYYTYKSGDKGVQVDSDIKRDDQGRIFGSYGETIDFNGNIVSDREEIKDGVYLAGLYVSSSKATGFIEDTKITLEKGFVDKYIGNRYTDGTITVVPVYRPKSAYIYFPKTTDGQIVNHGSTGSNDIMKVNRIDNVEIRAAANAGKYVSGFNVLSSKNSNDKFYSDKIASGKSIKDFRNEKLSLIPGQLEADREGVSWNESNSSTLNLVPNALVSYIEPYFGTPSLQVRANPRNQYKIQGAVLYIDDSDTLETFTETSTESTTEAVTGADEAQTTDDVAVNAYSDDTTGTPAEDIKSQTAGPMRNEKGEYITDSEGNVVYSNISIDPMTMGKTYTFNATTNEGYTTKWQDFTGDVNGDGVLDASENNESLNIDRSAVVGSVFNYIAKSSAAPIIYYGFYPKAETSGNNSIIGRAVLVKKGIFGSNEITEPIANARVTMGDLQTTTDANGMYSITSADFADGDRVMVNIIFDNYAYTVTQNVNVYQTVSISEYDGISVTNASISKENGTGYTSVNPTDVATFDANLKISLSTKSDSDTLYADQAVFNTYSSAGDLICSDTVHTQEASGKFDYVFNPTTKGISPGSRMTVQFIDQNSGRYIEHELGFTFMKYLGNFAIQSSFIPDSKPSFDLLGTIDSTIGLGHAGKSEDFETSEVEEAGVKVQYQTLYFGFSKGFEKDFDTKPMSKKLSEALSSGKNTVTVKDENGNETEKSVSEVAKEGTETGKNGNNKEAKVTAEASFSISIGLEVVMEKGIADPNQYCFDSLLFTVTGEGGVGMEASIPTPIAINVVIGFKVSGEITGTILISRGDNAGETYFNEEGIVDFGDMADALSEKNANNLFAFYGSLSIKPSITLYAGVGLSFLFDVKVTGTATFDMNFDSLGNQKGDVTFSTELSLKVLFFKKDWTLYKTTKTMFKKDGNVSANMVDEVVNAFSNSGNDLLYTPVTEMEKYDLGYMADRGGWNGDTNGVVPFSTDADASSYRESTLLEGANPYSHPIIKGLGDGRYMMVFIDDDMSKDEYNYATASYSIYSNGTWSKPVAIDNDETADEAPDIYVLDNGMVIAAWSSAEVKLTAEDTAITSLNKMNIKAAIFDGTAFGEPMEVTHTTAADYCADTQPKFTSGTYLGRDNYVMLYYVKSEYSATEADGVIGDLINPYTVTAYMFYDVDKGEWVNTYSEEDKREIIDSGDSVLSNGQVVTDANFDQYEAEWYGQSFVDLGNRLTINDAELYDEYGRWTAMPEITVSEGNTDPLVVDSDAISYNNLSIFAYTVDYDETGETITDREIFVLVYDYDTNEFFHPIQITSNDVSDSHVKLRRFEDTTYLVWLSDGNIKAVNFSNIYRNCLLEQDVEGKKAYVVDKSSDEYEAETIIATADENTEIGEFILATDELNSIYLIWTQSGLTYKEGIDASMAEAAMPENQYAERQIYAKRIAHADTEDSENKWSTAKQLTTQQGANFSNIAAFTQGKDSVNCVATKGMSGLDPEHGAIEDVDTRKIVNLSFDDFDDLEMSDIEAYSYMGNGTTNVGVTVTNKGFEAYRDLSVKFYGDGNLLTEEKITDASGTQEFISGSEMPVGATVSGNVIKVELYSGDTLIDTKELNIEYTPDYKFESASVDLTNRYYADFNFVVTNQGTAAGENILVQVVSKATDEVIAEDTVDLIDVDEEVTLDITAPITDSMFVQRDVSDENNYYEEIGEFDIIFGSTEQTVSHVRYITKSEQELLSSVSPVLNGGSESISVPVGDYDLVYDSVTDEYSALQVMWESSDTNVARVNAAGLVTGVSEGSAVITARIMPTDRTVVAMYDGSTDTQSIYNEIPEEGIIVRTINVNVVPQAVTEPTTEATTATTTEDTEVTTRRSVGGGSSSSKASGTATTTEAASEAVTDEATEATTQSTATDEGTLRVFDDVKGTWAETPVMTLAEMGIVSGIGNNLFAPERNITRAEYVTMLMRLLEDRVDVDATTAQQFSDIPAGTYYSDYVLKARALGIAAGYENNQFKPDNSITRQEMFAFTERALISLGLLEADEDYTLTYGDLDSISPYAVEPIRNLTAAGIITGSDNLIKPLDNAKRNEAAQMMYAALTGMTD